MGMMLFDAPACNADMTYYLPHLYKLTARQGPSTSCVSAPLRSGFSFQAARGMRAQGPALRTGATSNPAPELRLRRAQTRGRALRPCRARISNAALRPSSRAEPWPLSST
jgi:hypothetical protein